MNFQSTIFNYFTLSDKRLDTYKDSQEKGILERFNECVGNDMDKIAPMVDNMLENLYMPETCFDRYVPYLESMLGFDINKGLVYLFSAMAWRRKVLKHILRYYHIKGTKKGYQVLFQMLGVSMTLTEYYNDNGFDSPLTFDAPERVWDMGRCSTCSKYSLDLTGPIMTPSLQTAIENIIKFNEPINAKIKAVIYNGVAISISSFSTDFNFDFF